MNVRRATTMGCTLAVGGASEHEYAAIRALFAEYDRVFSRFRPGSELNRVNAAAGEAVVVSTLFAAALRTALAAARTTGGLVDPTLGRALAAAGYDRDFETLEPDGAPVVPGPPGTWRCIRLQGRILLPRPGIELDLNGVVKSAAVDEAVRLLERPGFVSAGGDLAVNAGLDVELPGRGAVRLERGGLATSGTLTRRWRRGGELAHHLIDPRTGSPSTSPWAAVTVCGGSCLAADVAAKAAFLAADGPAWLDARGLPGRFLDPAGAVVTTRHWIDDAALRAA